MTVVYATSLKNTRMQAVVNAIDAGSGFGQLVIGDVTLSSVVGIIARVPLLKPSFSVGAGVMTLIGPPPIAYALATGLLSLAELRDSDDVTIVSGLTIGLTGCDFTITNPNLVVGMALTVVSGAIQHA